MKLENFPPMPNLTQLLLANNRIQKIESNLSKYLPNLKHLVLQGNQIAELGDLEPLMHFEKLKTLVLKDNLVYLKPHYRLFMIHKCPQIVNLDYMKVKEKVRLHFFIWPNLVHFISISSLYRLIIGFLKSIYYL